MPKNIDAPIVAVTLYTDRARLTRKSKISLTPQETKLIIAGLPTTILTDSFRVTGQGTISVKIKGVTTETIFSDRIPIARIAELDRQIKNLQIQAESQQNQLSSLQLQLNFIKQLSEKSQIREPLDLLKQEFNLEKTQELLKFIGDKYLALAENITAIEQKKRLLNEQILALEKQKESLHTPEDNKSLNLIIAVETSETGLFELETSYIVTGASWSALYDLQVNTFDRGLNLAYLAQVQQNTGEDWTNIALSLSTAKPGLGSLPAKIPPLYVSIAGGNTTAKAAKMPRELISSRKEIDEVVGTDKIEAAFEKLERNTQTKSSARAEVVAAKANNSGSALTFVVNGDSNIPSDGTPHKVTIFNDRYPCKLNYLAIPRLVSFAYLEAVITNPASGVTLLPGKANIFRENTFIGTTDLENIAPNQEFKLNLGIDERWKIDRELIQRQVDKKIIKNRRHITYAYRLRISNLFSHSASLKLIELLPVSRHEQLKVHLKAINPKIKLGEMGILEWNLTIPSGEKQEIYYQFAIEYPPNRVLKNSSSYQAIELM